MPLKELLDEAFAKYCEAIPWARDYELSPKSILRDMVENADDFKGYVARYNIARSEGLLLRYLSDAYHVLDRTLPAAKRNEQLDDVIAWLSLVVRTVDSSLVDEWAGAGTQDEAGLDAAAPESADTVVRDRRGLTVLVRNALFARVQLAARRKARELGDLDGDWGWTEARWDQSLDEYFDVHEEILLDGDARSWSFLTIDEIDENSDHLWHVHQTFSDEDGDRDFGIMADVDLDGTQEEGEAVFKNYRVGFIEGLLDTANAHGDGRSPAGQEHNAR